MEDLQKITEHQKNERIKKVYKKQLKMSLRFGQAPQPIPPAITHLYPNLIRVQQRVASNQVARRKNPMEKVCFFVFYGFFLGVLIFLLWFDLASITHKMADMDLEDEVPKIKPGNASCVVPFTSKLSRVSASECCRRSICHIHC